MKIVVTGGAGFIGSSLCKYLIMNTHAEVVVIDKLTYASSLSSLSAVSENPRFKFLKLDICSSEDMRAVFESEKPDLIMHLAAESHVDRSITGSRAFIDTNIIGTYNLLEAARGYWFELSANEKDKFRFVHVSTDEVYGSLGEEGLFREDTAYDPSSPYSASKAASDHLATAWHRTYGLPVIISNCSNNYGPHQFPEKLIPLVILNAMENLPLPVYGDGSNVRDWLYVEDHVKALYLIAQKGKVGDTYNIGGNNERSNLEVVHTICDVLDELIPVSGARRDLIEFVTDRPGHDHRYAIDATKITKDLGWAAEENFDTGIRETIVWYLENANWWEPLRKGVYGGQRLGLKSVRSSA